jgi:HEAT repeat protein
MEACLRHPHPLVRAAAALSYFGLTSEPSRLIGILEDCTQSDDDLVRHVAATGLARLAPESPRLSELSRKTTQATIGSSAHTSLLVHGTWAANEQWWNPEEIFILIF